ncbi:MAG: SAM-dependent chlorinase/fluorinase [bacterium]|nr:SAM-dependent chlorinase/fluorinase [bacterium]
MSDCAITLTTDFGLTDPFVGIMKGVIARRAPGVAVIDVSHGIPPQDVFAGALVLRHAVAWFPPGSVHVAVVDPGVGSARRALAVEIDDGILVGPDNGVLALAFADGVRRAVVLTEERFFLRPRSHTFHGRDVFAPIAAAIATGTDLDALGPRVDDPVRLALPAVRREGARLHGTVIYVDHFGNLVTNIAEPALPAGAGPVSIAGVTLPRVDAAYAAVDAGQPVALINSWGLLEVAVRDGSARTMLDAGVGTPVAVGCA